MTPDQYNKIKKECNEYADYLERVKRQESTDTVYLDLKEKCEQIQGFIRDAHGEVKKIRDCILDEDMIPLAYNIGKLEMMFGLCVQLLDDCKESEEPLTP